MSYPYVIVSFFNCGRQYPFLGMIMFKLCFDRWTPFNQTRDTVFDNERFCKTFKSDGQEISSNEWQELKNRFSSFFVHR